MGGLGLGCPKTGCPLISPMGSFQELHDWNQHEKPVKMIYNLTLSEQNQLICHSSLGWVGLGTKSTCLYIQGGIHDRQVLKYQPSITSRLMFQYLMIIYGIKWWNITLDVVDISGLDDHECHLQCRWQRVTEYIYFYITSKTWRRMIISWILRHTSACISYAYFIRLMLPHFHEELRHEPKFC